jgi:hypothetical protein
MAADERGIVYFGRDLPLKTPRKAMQISGFVIHFEHGNWLGKSP